MPAVRQHRACVQCNDMYVTYTVSQRMSCVLTVQDKNIQDSIGVHTDISIVPAPNVNSQLQQRPPPLPQAVGWTEAN